LRQHNKDLLDAKYLVPTMGGNNTPKLDFKVPFPFTPEKEKEQDDSDGKTPSVNLTLDANGPQIAMHYTVYLIRI
jgi:hypothetical protein